MKTKYTFLYIVALASLLFLEHLSNIAGSAIKTLILVYLLANVIKIRAISPILILFCLSFLFNANYDFGFGIINELIQIIYFPVSFYFFYRYFKDKKALSRFSNLIAYTVIFSSLFFLFNILTQNTLIIEQLEVLNNKIDDNSKQYFHFGFFDHPQVASKIYVLSTIVLLFKKNKALLDYVAISLGIYLVYITYVRLGWLVLFVAFIFFILQQKSKKLKLLFLSLFGIGVLAVFPMVINRILNFNNVLTLTSISSGRDLVILKTIDFLQNISLSQFIFGSGFEVVMNNIGYAHNRFFEIFVFGGLISFILWIGIYLKILGIIKTFIRGNYLVISVLFLIIMTMLLSHGFSPYLAILCAISIVSSKAQSD